MRFLFAALCLGSLAGISADSSHDDLEQRIERALRRARPALLRALSQTQGNALTLVCLAGVHDGLGSSEAAFARAIRRVARLQTSGTYAPALRLMVAEGYPDFPDRQEVARRDLAVLLSHQSPAGGFGYVADTSYQDLSNTQYAALGLRAAVGLGLPVAEDRWQRLLAAALDAQNSHGGFSYHHGEAIAKATLSMTTAGLTVLEICRQHLPRLPARDLDLDAAIAKGWEWIARHRDQIGDRSIPHCFYAHWGLERAGILSARSSVGAIDWYAVGAEMLLDTQRSDGDFRSRTDSHGKKAHTAFAVLFLRRKFERVAGPLTGDRSRPR